MKFNENQFQSTIEPYTAVTTDAEEIKKFIEWEKLQEKINELQLKKRDLELSNRTVEEIKEVIGNSVDVILAGAKKDLQSEVRYFQEHQGKIDGIVEKLIRVSNLKNLKVDFVTDENCLEGTKKVDRILAIEKIERQIKARKEEQEQFQAKKVWGREPYKNERNALSLWRFLAPRFCEACSPGGAYLNSAESEKDRQLLALYLSLGLDKIPKIRLMNPIIRKNGVLDVPYPHGSPSWEIKE